MVDFLAEHKDMKFIWAEISYFSMWWKDADPHRKKQALSQIKSGQMELVTGGWVMNDEANPHFYSMLDQLIEGHQWIKNHLGPDIKPVSGWAIDPFGHTSTMPYLLRRIGFHSMLIQRTHYQVKKHLARETNLEFMWRQIWDHGSSTDILCHMMPFYSYDVPHTCGPDPKICCQFDFRRLPGGRVTCPWRIPPVPITEQNVAERATMLLDQYKKKAKLYKTNVVLIPLGDDFRYDLKMEPAAQYDNYQKIFNYINSHPEMHAQAQFGTLKDYFQAIYQKTGTNPGERPPNFVSLSGDFYTYADRDDHYWSGYYTSRPYYKNLDRVMEAHHRGAEMLFYLAHSHAKRAGVTHYPADKLSQLLTNARRNMGLFQHHDAITGTAKDFVVVDYGNRLHRSLQDMQNVMQECMQFLLSPNKAQEPKHILKPGEDRPAQDANPIKEVIILSSSPRSVYVYNSLPEQREQVVSLFVSDPLVTVRDSSGDVVISQTNLVWDARNKISSVKYELLFVASVPPLGVAVFKVKLGSVSDAHNRPSRVTAYTRDTLDKPTSEHFNIELQAPGSEVLTMNNHLISAEFDSTTGMLKSITTKADGSRVNVDLEFMTYGTKSYGDRSGAYLFLPDGPAKPHTVPAHTTVFFTSGKVMQEVRVVLPNVVHVVRLYRTDGPEGHSLDIQNTVDVRSMNNKEFVMRLRTDIQNKNREFYSDLNGFSYQRRRTLDKLPIQANFYPMPTMAFLEDSNHRLSLLSAQPNGVAGLQTGMLEVVMDRRLLQDDNRGLGQGVTDNKETPSHFRLVLERFQTPTQQNKRPDLAFPSLLTHLLSQHLLHPQFIFLAKPDAEDTATSLSPGFTGLQSPLPCDVSLLMLRSVLEGEEEKPSGEALMVLHRRGYECGLSSSCIKDASGGKLKLGELFKDLPMSQATRTSLSMLYDQGVQDPTTPISLDPMELHSYRVKLS
ncbi:predicted protein [Nematostella vectensis]|uniref:Alpha-mannosidase n=1 Tax=Nematostella vectensis TaxID=45351 RepID=A7S628_NEMVE|nr:predicted protein [Nematostella vectensis]|eukprot:XP_001632929.1 predicted protein [Nematostella vectensis]